MNVIFNKVIVEELIISTESVDEVGGDVTTGVEELIISTESVDSNLLAFLHQLKNL